MAESDSPIPLISNYLVWSILVTIICCPPTGIYAIICSSKVDGLVMAGRIEEAKAKSAQARNWCVITVILGLAIFCFCVMKIGS